MAVKPFSKEQLNFFKFSTLVLDEFPKVLRQIFITMWDSKVAVKPGFIAWDDSCTVRNMLLTSEGGKTEIPTTKSIEEWDCTALFKATIYAKTFGVPTLHDLYLKTSKPFPGSFHPSVHSSSGNQDETYALAIDQLRLLRNALCHSPKPEIVKRGFDYYVQLVKDSLSVVNVDTSFVDDIGKMSEDDFLTEKVQELSECRVKELQAVSMFHENMEQKLFSIDERTETIDERTEKIEKMMDNISLRDKRNAPDTLPKPHVPSAVPMFTGREEEIEEIANLITDQSTRLLNIWGSPGFGKTSTAIAVARNLSSLGYPVYFFKLQSITTEGEFLSQILSIFKSNVVDLSLTPLDRLVSILREISFPIYLIFDNLDDFLSHVTDAEGKLFRTFDKFLDSSNSINILFTTRELLENMRGEVEGFQDVRIRPLNPFSSVEFVRKLIPLFSENIVAQVAAICSHVPLAMKLVASLVKNNTENIANEILAELKFPENVLKQLETNMQKLFDILFERLSLRDKQGLISLTAFSSATISKDAGMYVVSGEMESKSNAAGSLKTLVAKSLIDEDLNGKFYSIHPLICSFVVDKAKRNDFENVLYSSRIRFFRYYLCLFERLNEDFLAGKSVDSPHLQETMWYLSIAMFQSITGSFETSQDVFRILSKSEIFLFSIRIPFVASLNIHELYDLALEKCRTCNNIAYLKLYVSKYFRNIAFSQFVPIITNSDIPEDIRKEIMSLSDGTAAKLCCYEGILQIHKENIKSGIQVIEKHLEDLQKCPDQQLLKCLCLQLLALFYTDLKECKKSSDFSRKAIEVCEEIGNNSLFLIIDRRKTVAEKDDKSETLILFVHLLLNWSKAFETAETLLFLLSYVYRLQQQKENEVFVSLYLYQILTYGDGLLAVLDTIVGEQSFLNEKIDSLHKSLKKCISSEERTIVSMPEKPASLVYLPERLLSCYTFKSTIHSGIGKEDLSIEECRNALDICLQQHGEVHEKTAYWYVKMGFAQKNAEDYTSALQSFDQAHGIMKATDDGTSCNHDNDIVADMYYGMGGTYDGLFKFHSAVSSFEEALKMKRKVHCEETEGIAKILFSLGLSQYCSHDLYTALTNIKQALQIFLKFQDAKSSSSPGTDVVNCYCIMGQIYFGLGNNTDCKKCFETALNISQKWQDCDQRHLLTQGLMCSTFLYIEEGENRFKKLFERCSPMFKEHFEFLLPLMYAMVGAKQLHAGKYQAGLANVQKALDVQLDVTLQAPAAVRVGTVSCYITQVMPMLLEIEKVGFARRVLERAFKIAESLPEGRKHIYMFRYYYWKGSFYNVSREYVSAIESLEHALHLFEASCEDNDKMEQVQCRQEIVCAQFFLGAYKDALVSSYRVLSMLKDILPEGSEDEAEMYLMVAKIAGKMNNKSLVVSNLRLAYKMHSKVLGKNHPATERSYVKYVSALINQ